MVIIRPATKNDVESLIPDVYGKSLRAIVIEVDGKLLGITGVIHTHPLQCFGQFGDELRKKPKALVKFAHALRPILDSYLTPVYADADESIEASGRFLEFVGFKKAGELYKWHG